MAGRTLRAAVRALVVVAAATTVGVAGAEAVRDLPDEEALRLLTAYEPVLFFSTAPAAAEELFRPSDPFEFALRAALQRRVSGGWETVAWDRRRLPTSSPCARAPCWRLNIGPNPGVPTFSPSLGRLIEPVYALRPPGGGSPWARTIAYGRATTGADCCPGWVALQYWFFYPYNVWTRNPLRNDDYFQAHEGDWEAVVVVLDDTGAPRWAGFTQHEGGEGRSWQRVTNIAGHPVVYVARGSHANYFEPGLHPIPLPTPALARVASKFRISVFDVANQVPPGVACPPYAWVRGAVLGPSSLATMFGCYRTMDVGLLRWEAAWAGYRGLWGEDQWIGRGSFVERFRVSPGRVIGRALWSDPVGTTLAWCRRHNDCLTPLRAAQRTPGSVWAPATPETDSAGSSRPRWRRR